MLLPSLCAVLGLGLAAGWAQREAVRSNQALTAQAAALQVAGYVAEARSDLRHALLHMEEHPGHRPGELLAMLQDSFRQFNRFLILAPDKSVTAAAPPVAAGSRFPREYLDADEADGLIPRLSPFTGLPAVYLHMDARDGRSLVGKLSLSALQGFTSRLASLAPGEDVALTDAFGNVLAHPDQALVDSQANIGDLEPLRRARQGGPQFGDYGSPNGRRIGTAVQVPDTGWLLLVSQPALSVYGPIAAMVLSLSTLLAGLFLLLAYLTESTLRRAVVEPLADFTAAVQDIGRGRMRAEFPPGGTFRELSLLLEEFNAARGALAVRDAALRASEAKYREIFENALEGLFQSTPQGRYISANPALARILGYGSPAELMAEMADIRGQLYANPGDRDELLRLLEEYGEVRDFETVFRRRDGAPRWCSVNARARRGEDGAIALIEGVVEDVTERREAAEKLRASLHEKEVLLKEVHHRVKNNLQVVSGLLYLQADSLQDPAARAALAESQNRIASMALAHEALYGSDDLARVDLKDYVGRLMTRLVSSLGNQGVAVEADVSAVPLPLTKAIPCGLILNELVTNAVKYAFDGPGGRISVHIRREGPRVELSVADDGRGLPAHISPETATTLGLQLVANLTAQLKGELRISRENGTLFTIRFPLEDAWQE
jgi:PAS domain S-box-containing protein